MNILWDLRYIVVVAIAFIVFCIFQWQNGKVILYALMLQAKSLAKDAVLKSGDEQQEWVVNKAYQFLPLSLKIFISEDTMRQIIKWLYHKAKDYLDDGKINGSI